MTYNVHDLDSGLERFLSTVSEQSAKWLVDEWEAGVQLAAMEIPQDCITPALLMAAFCREHDIHIVDEYTTLCLRWEQRMVDYAWHPHPDLWLASVCCINRENNRSDTLHVFEQLRYPEMFHAFFGEPL